MTLDVTRIQGLCFDVDGTLNDTDDQIARTLAGWLKPFKAILPGQDPQPIARRLVMFSEAPGNFILWVPDRLAIDDEIARMLEWFHKIGLPEKKPYFELIEGIRPMLEALSQHYPLSIVSARGEKSTRKFLDQFELTPFFRCVAGAQTCARTKPYADPILWSAEQMGIAPANCLMIGDTPVDIRAGRAAGAQTVGVLCGFGAEKELRRHGADFILNSTVELGEILLKKSSI